MKKVLLFAVSAFLFTAPAFAQVNVLDISPALEKKCTHITQTMAQELRLNESAYIRLKALNRKHLVKSEELLQAYSENETVLQEKMREAALAYEQEIISLLTPKQLDAYAAYKKEDDVAKFVAAKASK